MKRWISKIRLMFLAVLCISLIQASAEATALAQPVQAVTRVTAVSVPDAPGFGITDVKKMIDIRSGMQTKVLAVSYSVSQKSWLLLVMPASYQTGDRVVIKTNIRTMYFEAQDSANNVRMSYQGSTAPAGQPKGGRE